MRHCLLAILVTCGSTIASDVCQDWKTGLGSFDPAFPWKTDSAYFVETSKTEAPNDWSWKYQYGPSSRYPTSMTVDFLEGAGPRIYPIEPSKDGFTIAVSATVKEHYSFSYQVKDPIRMFVQQSWRTQNDTVVDSIFLASWNRQSFGLEISEGFADTLRTYWSGDTLFDAYIPSAARNREGLSRPSRIDTCRSVATDSCVCRNGSSPTSITRKPWGRGLVLRKARLDTTDGDDVSMFFLIPLDGDMAVEHRKSNPLHAKTPTSLRWNGARSSGSSTSTNPLELLRHGQIPTPAAP